MNPTISVPEKLLSGILGLMLLHAMLHVVFEHCVYQIKWKKFVILFDDHFIIIFFVMSLS